MGIVAEDGSRPWLGIAACGQQLRASVGREPSAFQALEIDRQCGVSQPYRAPPILNRSAATRHDSPADDPRDRRAWPPYSA
jgi:hypothetical protein